MAHRFLALTPREMTLRACFPELFDADRFRTLPPDGLDSWDLLLGRLGDWHPEALVLDLPRCGFPDWLAAPPVPVVGLLTEAKRNWHACRADLSSCDALLVDALPAALSDRLPVTLLPRHGSWSAHLELVARGLSGRGEHRFDPVATLLGRVVLALDEPELADGKDLAGAVASLLRRHPRDSRLLNALAVLTHRLAGPADGEAVERVRDLLVRAVEAEPQDFLAIGNLIDLALEATRNREAAALAERGLRVLDVAEASRPLLDPSIRLRADSGFRREWDAAAWNATSPEAEDRAKRELVRGHCHTVFAALTGRLLHFTEAAVCRPSSPAVRAALGCALAREGRLAEAVGHLRFAVETDPFDAPAARALGRVYEDQNLLRPRRDLQVSRCELAAKHPEHVPTEPWFAEAFPLPPADPAESLALAWRGDFDAVHSLARVNREVTVALARRGHRVAPLRTDLGAEPLAPIAEPSVHVTHHWPPLWSPPEAGRWVVMQPWEYSGVPAAWVDALDRVDELWVPAHSVKEAFVQSGVPADRVAIVPLGVDSDRFRPDGERYPLQTRKRFKFLFVGGTIQRKGFDLLLNAYAGAFTAEDDICLVVKDLGTATFYRGQTAGAWVDELRSRPGAPEVEYLDAELSEADLAALYRSCDCLVAPFRGEGFALPVAEAMASGLPVVVTEAGPVLDYCDSRFAWFVPAGQETFPKEQLGAFAPAADPSWAAPDPAELRRLLRRVLESPEEARVKGRAARRYAAEHLTWAHTAASVEERVRELRVRTIRRSGPDLVPAPEARLYRGTVSLCLIVRNEEANLGACLESARGLFDETVVVDTGSTDGTKEIATRMGARVLDFSWVDDFAAARNESLRHATGDWVFWMDADDRLGPDDRDRLRALIRSLRDENAAYVLKCSCTPSTPGGAAVVVDHVRLFRNDPRLRWKYRVHEQILPAVRRTGGEVRWSDVVVEHVGYRDPALRHRKLQRDLRLLKREEQEQPDDPFTLFNLGSVYQELGELPEAVRALQRSLRGSAPRDSIVRKIYALLTQCHRELGESDAALAACREGRGHYPRDAELLFLESLLRRQRGETDAAVACLEELLATQEEPHFASVDPSLRGVKAHHNLAILRFEAGVRDRAETHWRSALALDENFLPAWLGLVEIHLREGNREGIEKIIARLERLSDPGPFEAFRLRVRWRTESGDAEGAEGEVRTAIDRDPRSIPLRLLLVELLTRRGGAEAEVRTELERVREIDPTNPHTREQLDRLAGW